MQELSLTINERIKKTKEVIQNHLNVDAIRSFREEEKNRCEKENFVLTMMRNNKIISPTMKKTYLRISEELMTLLQPSFSTQRYITGDQDFLNDFVQLYTSFFAYFEDKFSFKTKIKNILRPTNHNLIIDLIKYFVDFTRDYYVQTLIWKMRNSGKSQGVQIVDEESLIENGQQGGYIKVKPLGKISRSYSCYNESVDGTISPRKRTAEQGVQKVNSYKNYQILDVTIPSILTINPKQISVNIDSLRTRINQYFRDQKSRNVSIKRIYDDYLISYNEKHNVIENTGSYLTNFKRSDQLNRKCYPWRFVLSVERNGFTVILLQLDNKRHKNSYFVSGNKSYFNTNHVSISTTPNKPPTEHNSLSPLKSSLQQHQQRAISIQQTTFKCDYFLTSMKVLRVSQNFLPPLVNSNAMSTGEVNQKRVGKECAVKCEVEKDKQVSQQQQQHPMMMAPLSLKLRRTVKQIQQHFPAMIQPVYSVNNNVLIRSTSFKNSTSESDKRRLQKFNNQLYSGEYIQKELSNIKLSRKDSQESSCYREKSRKVDIKKKLIEDRRSFENGVNANFKYQSKLSTHLNYQSEQKVLQWLEKIRNLKQIQRRKILGMNF